MQQLREAPELQSQNQSETNVVPLTWAGFNAVCSGKSSLTNTEVVAPILRVSPTSLTPPYTALKLTMNINAMVVGCT